MSGTSFKLVKEKAKQEEDFTIAEPLLTSFPNNIPSKSLLKQLQFSIEQYDPRL